MITTTDENSTTAFVFSQEYTIEEQRPDSIEILLPYFDIEYEVKVAAKSESINGIDYLGSGFSTLIIKTEPPLISKVSILR